VEAYLISSLPIQGFEKVNITIKDVDDQEHKYELYVYKVFDRFSTDRVQFYTLGLISKEALINETERVPKTLAGKPEGIVSSLLKDYLKTSKKFVSDASQFKIRFHPGKKTPFSIIQSIQHKAVSERIKAKTGESSGGDEYAKSSGSAGYYFYETLDGYNFRAIDSLNDRKQNAPKKVFVQENEQLMNQTTDARYKISESDISKRDRHLNQVKNRSISFCYMLLQF